MSCVIIYPMELSPVPLSDPPENMTGSHIRFLFGLASDGVYMAFSVTRETVVSYTAFPPLPGKTWRYLSVALSLESPPPDVIRHPALRSPDFPHLLPFGICSCDYLSYLHFSKAFIIIALFIQNNKPFFRFHNQTISFRLMAIRIPVLVPLHALHVLYRILPADYS